MTPDEFAAELVAAGSSIQARAEVVTRVFEEQLLSEIKTAAPGQNYPATFGISGDEVGTDDPRGFRFELGFHGADSLGRVYAQAGHPHVDPSVNLITPQYLDAIDALGDL